MKKKVSAITLDRDIKNPILVSRQSYFFHLFNTIQLTVNKCLIKICRRLDSNRGHLASKATLCQLSHNHCHTSSVVYVKEFKRKMETYFGREIWNGLKLTVVRFSKHFWICRLSKFAFKFYDRTNCSQNINFRQAYKVITPILEPKMTVVTSANVQ